MNRTIILKGIVRSLSLLFILVLSAVLISPTYAVSNSSKTTTVEVDSQLVKLSVEEKNWFEQHPVIRVHNEKSWAPFNFFEDGVPKGLSIDYMNLLSKKLGIKIRYQTGPSWNEFLQQIQAKDIDVMLNIVKTENRQKYLLYTKPYIKNPNVIISRDDNPISSVDELQGRTVAFPKGFFYEEVLTRDYPEIKRLTTDDLLESLKAVTIGQADAALGEYAVVRYQINHNLLTNIRVSGAADIGNPDLENLRIGVRNDWPLLHSAINKAMAQVTPNEMEAINQRWLTHGVAPETANKATLSSKLSPAILLTTFIIIGLALFLILLLLRRLGYGSGEQLFEHNNLSKLVMGFVTIFLVVVVFVAWVALERMDRQLRSNQGETLVTVNNAVKESLKLWQKGLSAEARHVSGDYRILPLVKKLLALPPYTAALVQSSSLKEFRELYNEHNIDIGALGFFIINPNGISLASSRDTNIGTSNLIVQQRPKLIARVFAGESLFIPPIFSDVVLKDATGRVVNKASTMFYATPIKDESGEVIAVMTLRFDPVATFSKVSLAGQIGESGETYIFDKNGRLISESRFADELDSVTEYYREGDQLLSLRIADPGGDLQQGFRPQLKSVKWPLTQMANKAVAGRGGVDTNGYRDYRGVAVMGAWSWLDDLGIGVATEIDVSESLESYHSMRQLIVSAFGGVIFVSLLLTALTVWIGERARKHLTILVDKRTEELRKLAQAVEQSPLSVVITNVNGDIEHVNPRFTQITGYEADEVIGKNPRVLKSGETSPGQYKKLWKTILSGKVWHAEIHNRKKNGDLYWGAISIAPVTNDAGEVTHFVAMTADITDTKNVELALHEVQEYNELILESAAEGIFGLDTLGDVTFCNQAGAEMLGYQRNELIGISMHETTHYAYADGTPYNSLECPMRAAFCDGERHEINNEVLWRKDGSSFPVEYTAVPMRKSGQLIGSVVMFKDITERKKAEQALDEERMRLRMILDTSPVGVGITTNNIIRYINSTGQKMLSSKVGDTSPNLYVHPEDREVLIGKLSKGESIKNYEMQMYGHDKQVNDMLATYTPIEYEGENGILGWLIDITKRKKAEAELQEKFDDLERFRKMAVDRELKMIELKKEINKSLQEQGKSDKYKIVGG